MYLQVVSDSEFLVRGWHNTYEEADLVLADVFRHLGIGEHPYAEPVCGGGAVHLGHGFVVRLSMDELTGYWTVSYEETDPAPYEPEYAQASSPEVESLIDWAARMDAEGLAEDYPF